jgi:ADP-heptose:LPS heptosyltransferase
MKTLIIRNDRLGDFLLSWPVFALLKHHYPEHVLSALLPEYTSPAATLCPWIDEIATYHDVTQIKTVIDRSKPDNILTLYSSSRVAIASWKTRTPYRLAPATHWWQIFYTHRLRQRRSHSKKPEYAYNLDLAYRFLYDHGRTSDLIETAADDKGDFLPHEIIRPLLYFPDEAINSLRKEFNEKNGLCNTDKLIFIHPGSGGSANNLRLEQYSQLALSIYDMAKVSIAFVISAGPDEQNQAQQLLDQLETVPAVILKQHNGIPGLARHIAFADVFISNSTGPLHLAGLLDRATAAFYPRHRSATPLRWQTLNAPEKRLAFVPPPEAPPDDVSSIDITAAAQQITEQFLY